MSNLNISRAWVINTRSTKYSCRNANLTFHLKIGQEFCVYSATTKPIESCLAMGENTFV